MRHIIYILLEGHDFEYDLFQLSKAFFPAKEIIFIENKEEYVDEGYLIESILYKKNNRDYARTNLYLDGSLSISQVEDIDSIYIGKEAGKQLVKTGVKKTIYDSLIGLANRDMPWGILTGIRPNKIVHDLLDREVEEEKILDILMNQYKLDKVKGKLLLDIARDQRPYIYPLDKDRYSLYIGIPFCPSKCVYCSFASLSVGKHSDLIEDYVDRLLWEIRSIKDLMKGKKIHTVYIGGGTPTAIPTVDLQRVIEEVYSSFGSKIREFTVEAGRPDTIDEEVLTMLKGLNVGRISINPQTMNNETLKLIGRNHSSEDIKKAYYLARKIGFNSINMDVIVGLPSEKKEDIIKTLEEIEVLNPENLTVHTLAVKRASEFSKTMEEYSIAGQTTIEEMIQETIKSSIRMKMKAYYLYRQKQIMGNFENVGYSKEGKECIYNMAIMEEKETIIGAGMGSVSKIFSSKGYRIKRVANFKGMREYLERTNELIERKEKALKAFKLI